MVDNHQSVSEEIVSLRGNVGALSTDISRMRSEFEGFKGEFRSFVSSQEERSRTNWPLLCSIAGVVFVFLTGIWYVIQLQTALEIQKDIKPIALSAESSAVLVAKLQDRQDVMVGQIASAMDKGIRSETDRENLNQTVTLITQQLASLNAEVKSNEARTSSKLVEIETQFRASDQSRSVQWASTLRWVSLIWEKVYGQKFPSEIQFYPSIAQQPL